MEDDTVQDRSLPGVHEPGNKIIRRKTVVPGDIKETGIMNVPTVLMNTDSLVPRRMEVQGDTLGAKLRVTGDLNLAAALLIGPAGPLTHREDGTACVNLSGMPLPQFRIGTDGVLLDTLLLLLPEAGRLPLAGVSLREHPAEHKDIGLHGFASVRYY